MAFYPKIMDIHIKDKYIDITLPLRAKRVILETLYCPDCDLKFKMTNLRDNFDMILWKYHNQGGKIKIDDKEIILPFSNTNQITADNALCPDCLINNGKIVNLRRHSIKKIKIFTSIKHNLLDILTMLRFATVLRFKHRYGKWGDASAWYDGFGALIEDIEATKRMVKKTLPGFKNTKLDIKYHKITEKMIDDAEEVYKQRKFLRNI